MDACTEKQRWNDERRILDSTQPPNSSYYIDKIIPSLLSYSWLFGYTQQQPEQQNMSVTSTNSSA